VTHCSYATAYCLQDSTQQLCLEDELALFVFLTDFVRLIVFPANCLLTLFTCNISDYVPASCHIAFARIAGGYVDYTIEEEGLAVLTTEIL